MVFSQTSHKTQHLLKVVDLDRLKSTKNQEANGKGNGVIAGGITSQNPRPEHCAPSTSYSEEFLKPEPAFESAMYHETDYGFFQDLEQWCSAPAKEEQVQTIDSQKVTRERALNNDTLHLPLSPHEWETHDPISPAQASMYCITPHDPLSPMAMADEFVQLDKLLAEPSGHQEQSLDFNSMPVVFADQEPEKMAAVNSVQVVDPAGWDAVADYKHYTNTQTTLPFIDLEDSLDSKFVSVTPGEVENNLTVNRFIFGAERRDLEAAKPALTVNVHARAPAWGEDSISTPDIVTYVQQLEEEKCPLLDANISNQWPAEEELLPTVVSPMMKASPALDYEPITPKSESQAESENETKPYSSSRKRRHDSEDSDKTYTPDEEYTPRNYTRRRQKKPIAIKEMILKLEGSQELTKARRGRPPKVRRESTVSVCSIDDSTSNVSTQEVKYRELRDKNNEASKRSRMNKKLKELQQEQLALDLEERNKKLKIKADILEEMTKKLKEALMSAILQK